MPLSLIFNITNVSFNAIRENKILRNISEFTVVFQISTLGLGFSLIQIFFQHIVRAATILFRHLEIYEKPRIYYIACQNDTASS